ncbi:MAG: ribonuclease E inhibitor RraB, partial [Crocinitomicaceae bacterium]
KQAPWTLYKKWEPTKYDWQQIGNAQVIEQLIEHGSNPEMTHKLEFSFGGEPAHLHVLRDELLKEKGEFLLLEGDLLEVIFESELDDFEINPLTYFLMDKAEEFACKFEGWRAPITN